MREMRSVTEDELCRSILKVIYPYEGSAFVVGPDLAVSCIHVCVPDGASPPDRHRVELEYRSGPGASPIRLRGYYLPEQSDPTHDLAVIRLELPADRGIPPVPLSLDYQPNDEVVALGFAEGQQTLDHVAGVIFDKHTIRPITFIDGTTLEVIQFDTRGQPGFHRDHEVRGGMSGGPIWNKLTGTIVAVIEGKRPRGSSTSPPDGYGIELKHLWACSSEIRPFIRLATPRFSWLKALSVLAAVVMLALVFNFYRLLPLPEQPDTGAQPAVTANKAAGAETLTLPHASPLELRLTVMKLRDGVMSVLRSGGEMTAQDHYGVFFEPSQEAFVYIMQQDTTGKIDILFPNPKWTLQTNPVPAGKVVWVPTDPQHWFHLDENVGREVILIAASRKSIERLESILRNADGEEVQGPLAEWILSSERGVGGVQRIEPKSLISPWGKTINLETTLVEGNGVDFVHKVEFHHK